MLRFRKVKFFFYFLFYFSFRGYSQHNLPLENIFIDRVECERSDTLFVFHSSVRPFIQHEVYPSRQQQNTEINSVWVGPVLDGRYFFEPGSAGRSPHYVGAGGIMMKTVSSGKFSAELAAWGGRYSLPGFAGTFAEKENIIPGLGLEYDMKGRGNIINRCGYISYTFSRYFDLQAGYDKNFFGDGYRSLLLSDLSSPYPFIKLATRFRNFKYVNLYGFFTDARGYSTGNPLHKKYGTFHYLSWNATRKFSLAVFESVIWKGTDTLLQRGYDVNYFNPFIFYRPVEYSVGSNDNVLLGLNSDFRPFRTLKIYAQVIIDEFYLPEMRKDFYKWKHPSDSSVEYGWFANKYGGQTGFKYFNAFGKKGLIVQCEINFARPFTYAHGNPLQNYSHLNQPLAHPLGANFQEGIAIAGYSNEKWFVNGKFVYALSGTDTGNYNRGGDIFKSTTTRTSEFYNTIGQGIRTSLTSIEVKGGVFLHPSSNLRIEAGIVNRMKSSILDDENSLFVWVGFRTAIFNEYYDY